MSRCYEQKSYKSVGVWEEVRFRRIPASAVSGGKDKSGQTLYVGRAEEWRNCIPGMVNPSKDSCFVGLDDRGHEESWYQVLSNPNNCPLDWVPAPNGELPLGALQGGKEKGDIGRANYQGAMVIGKVCPRIRLYVGVERSGD